MEVIFEVETTSRSKESEAGLAVLKVRDEISWAASVLSEVGMYLEIIDLIFI